MTDLNEYGPLSLRIVLGLLFVLPGAMKLMSLISTGTHMVADMLWGVVALAWLLALVELLGGLAVLAGWQLKYAVWPLIVVLLGAVFLAVLPSDNPMMLINLLFHLLGVAGLLSLFFTGPGALAVQK